MRDQLKKELPVTEKSNVDRRRTYHQIRDYKETIKVHDGLLPSFPIYPLTFDTVCLPSLMTS